MMNKISGKLKLREKIGYAFGDAAANFAWRPLVSFLPFFYTDVVGLPLAAVTSLLLIARSFDGITDIVMGLIGDRTNTRWGKFRPWLLWTSLPFGFFLVLTFTNPKLGGNGNLFWAYCTYIILTLLYTANNVPYSALMGVLTGNVEERTKISSFRFFGAFGGGALVLGLTKPLVNFFGNGNESMGYQYTYYVFAGILVLFSLIAFWSTKERVTPPNNTHSSLKSDFTDLFKNRPWVLLLFIGLLWVAYNSIKQGVTMYYFTHYLDRDVLGGTYLASLVIISMVATLIAPYFTRLFGKRNFFILTLLFSSLVNALIYFAGPENVAYVFIVGNISEIGAAIFPVLFFSMLGDAADYSEWKNDRRATGLVYSAGTFAMKFGGGIAGAVMLMVMKYYGYVEQENGAAEKIHQSARALEGIKLNMSLMPIIFVMAAIALLIFYPLGKEKMQKISNELEERRK